MVRLQTLITKFETFKMTELGAFDQFMTKFMGVFNQLRMNGEELEDQRIVEKVLRCLPKKFDMIVIVFESRELTIVPTSYLLKFVPTSVGVSTGLHLSILNFFKMSVAYHHVFVSLQYLRSISLFQDISFQIHFSLQL